ncbi:hypothetical protein RhiXN_05454 [Rhizoctonia solani]|uniref:Uncharacterized protein n=1 Tax=Rhizoctonia solani TaxID=456999 RepID=A0A8H8NRH2_9AGAM|nr:uncharacterized protein RhiXN_05454 [Rhizoctonia solani]QRW17452.1 hypothetical protein RhiXN_05454 [Rhizoctonia solani]
MAPRALSISTGSKLTLSNSAQGTALLTLVIRILLNILQMFIHLLFRLALAPIVDHFGFATHEPSKDLTHEPNLPDFPKVKQGRRRGLPVVQAEIRTDNTSILPVPSPSIAPPNRIYNPPLSKSFIGVSLE